MYMQYIFHTLLGYREALTGVSTELEAVDSWILIQVLLLTSFWLQQIP